MIKKIVSILVLVSICLMYFGISASASQQPPSGQPTIPNVWVYQNLFEPTDELYLIEINIPVPPAISLTASQTFLVNLLNGNEILGSVNPITNPYFAAGYGQGVIGMYFSAAQVAADNITWNTTNYSMKLLTTDPTANTWNGTAPAPYTLNSITNWYSINSETTLKNEIIALSGQFKASWGMSQIFISSGVLTTDGETYWEAAIPNLRLLCPIVFSGYVNPIIYNKPPNLSVAYALSLRSQWAGKWLDMSVIATDWGIDQIWFLGGFWLLVLMCCVVGYIALTNTNEGVEWIAVLVIFVGGILGFLPYTAAVMAVVVAGFAIWWTGFYRRSVQ